MRKLIVNKKYDNKKLNTFILNSFPELSQNMLGKALRQKDIRINGIRTKENVTIHENDEIAIYIADEFLFKNVDYQIIYEDDNILVINKPSGIEVVCSHSEEKSLSNILKEKYSFVEPCHRLDRNTSRFSFIRKK